MVTNNFDVVRDSNNTIFIKLNIENKEISIALIDIILKLEQMKGKI